MTTHRLNHHDIQVIEAVKARAQAQANAHRRADRIVIASCAVAGLALVALHVIGALPA